MPGDTRRLLRHRRTRRLVVATRDAGEGLVSAYHPAHLMDALDCLVRGYWGCPRAAEAVRDNPEVYDEVPEDSYGEELDRFSAWLNCL